MRIFILFFLIFSKTLSACDICGCGISGSTISGIMPQFNKNIFGVRQTFQRFKHPNTPENYNGTNRVLQDNYLSEELWLRYYPKPRIQTFVFLPYKITQRQQSDRNYNISGISDATLMANYAIINTSDSVNKITKTMWWAGGGIKLPTGKYQQRNAEKTMYPIGLQTGTGAYSILFNNQLTIRKGNIGFNWMLNYTANLTNELDYKMGDSYQSNLQIFYIKKVGCNTTLLPHIGTGFIHFNKDVAYSIKKMQSGGEQLLINVGLDTYIGKWMLAGLVQKPNHFNTYKSQPVQKLNYSLNIARFF